MNTSQLSAEIFRNLGVLAESEEMMARVAKYLRKLIKEKNESDPTRMTEEEFFAKLDQAEESIKQGKGTTFNHPDEMNAWLKAI